MHLAFQQAVKLSLQVMLLEKCALVANLHCCMLLLLLFLPMLQVIMRWDYLDKRALLNCVYFCRKVWRPVFCMVDVIGGWRLPGMV